MHNAADSLLLFFNEPAFYINILQANKKEKNLFANLT